MSRECLLYTRPGCTLCDEFAAAAKPLLREYGAGLRRVDISADVELLRRYRLDIPVLVLDDREICRHRLDRRALECALAGE